jgi:methionyl-tRNA formyltransferase
MAPSQSMSKYRTVALLGREPGLRVLRDALIPHPRLDLAAVYTHRMRPRSEGGGERDDYPQFVDCCAAAGIPLQTLEWNEASRELPGRLPPGPLDLLFVLSWRSIIPPEVIRRATLGGINIHRGALPDYAGALPVQRAIEAGETRIAITAHDLAPEIDTGQTLAVAWLDIPSPPPDHSAAHHAETVKTLLLPFYAPISRLAVDLRIAGGRRPQ